ncbi:sporulation protein [Paenibacillus sp. P26]|nr:sporulation protein [Paenibacillus sp. P26]
MKKSSYDWTITKASNVLRPVINPHQTFPLVYTLQIQKTLAAQKELISVRGTVTVTNGGGKATEGLKLVPQVQYKAGGGPFQNLAGASVTITPGQLQPGETKSYPYEIFFTPVTGGQYKVNAAVTITNHSGHLGTAFGPAPSAGFTLPAAAQSVSEDGTATVSDAALCPAGFTCTSSHPGPWKLTGADTITYTLNVTNNTAPILQIVPLKNTATVTEDDTKQGRTADNTVLIFTGRSCTKP